MIYPNELRIGNKVLYIGGRFIGNPDIVHEIVNVIAEKCIDYEPIPITEKILLAVGFEKFADHGLIKCYAKDIDEDSQILISLGQKYPYIELPNFWQCQHKRLSALHQLQNLYFFISGEELTYDPAH